MPISRHAPGAQIGAWASDQSREMENAFDLEKAVASYTARFGVGAVPRPSHWHGYRVRPEVIEFWEEKLFRLHRRDVFRMNDGEWRRLRLSRNLRIRQKLPIIA